MNVTRLPNVGGHRRSCNRKLAFVFAKTNPIWGILGDPAVREQG